MQAMDGPVGIAAPPATWSLETAYAYATSRAVPPTEPNGEPLYNCPFPPCGKQFSKRFNLKAHLRVHTGDKPFACSFPGCTRRFMWKSSLTSHQTGHSRRKAEMAKRNAAFAADAASRNSYMRYATSSVQHHLPQPRQLHPQYYPAAPHPQHIIPQVAPANPFPLQTSAPPNAEPSMSYITAEDSLPASSARSHIQQQPQHSQSQPHVSQPIIAHHPQQQPHVQHSHSLAHHPTPQSSLPLTHQQPQQPVPPPPDVSQQSQHPDQFATPVRHITQPDHNPQRPHSQSDVHTNQRTPASAFPAPTTFKHESQPDQPFADPQRRFLQQSQDRASFKQEPQPDQQFADPQKRFLLQQHDKMQSDPQPLQDEQQRLQAQQRSSFKQEPRQDQQFTDQQRRFMQQQQQPPQQQQDKLQKDPQQQLQEEQQRLQRQEREIKEQQRLLKQRQQHFDAELRRVQQLQDEERKRLEMEQKQRQGTGSSQQMPDQASQAPAQSAPQASVAPSAALRHETTLPFGRFEEQGQQFQRSVPPISNGRNGDTSRIVKKETSSVHLSKSSQSSLVHASSGCSLPLPSNQVIPSPLTCGRSPSASGFSQQFLFPSNVSASATSPMWATTPLVPPIPSSSGLTGVKPPHTPTNQMDVQMASMNGEGRSGDGSPSVVDVPISPGITSPVPPPMLPSVTNSRHRRALSGRSSKPPLSGPSLSSGPAALLPPLTNVPPANPPTHIDLGGLTDDEPNSSSLPALGSPHTELSPLPVASPIVGLGLTPTSPMQPFSPFGMGSAVPRGKQTATW